MSRNRSATTLPAESAPKDAGRKPVTLSDRVVVALGLPSNAALLVESGEVESVVEVDGQRHVVGNTEVE